MGGGRWESHATWSIALHADAPFGVVRVKSEGSIAEVPASGQALRGTVALTLIIATKGDKAKSELPAGKGQTSAAAIAPKVK
jgi:hypothetical protein